MHGMFGSRPSFLAFPVSALVLVLAPSLASAKVRRTARALDSRPCSKPSVEVMAGSESATFPLERCDGAAIPVNIDKLSILARAAGVAKPKEPLTSKPHGAEVAPGIRRLDARLAERLESVADHFRKEGEPTRIVLVAPKSRTAGSFHASGRAIDFRIEGVDNEALAAFCKTVPDTGCGFYPNGGFVHMDVRDAGAGHVAWIDISKAGEAPKYVSAWPLPADATKNETHKGETVSAEPPKEETARAEAPPAPPREAAKAEPSQEADTADEPKLPALPAAAAVVPMDDAPRTPAASESAPAKKHHRRHKKSRTSHMI